MNEFDHADKNKYLIGIKLNHSFGSDSNSLSSRIKNITKDIEKQKMNRIEEELTSYFDVLQKQINNAFDEIQTYESVIKYRKSIIAAMERSYQQGRVDIDQVIMALTNEYQAQVNLISAYAKYNLLKYEYNSQFN
jgi:outer membrane protein TolC